MSPIEEDTIMIDDHNTDFHPVLNELASQVRDMNLISNLSVEFFTTFCCLKKLCKI